MYGHFDYFSIWFIWYLDKLAKGMTPTLALTEPKLCMQNLPCMLMQYPITTVNIQKI